MKQRYYDAIILGDSLASQTAAALLVKGGCRILTFRLRTERPAALSLGPVPASRPIERLLEVLGARSCLAQAPSLQVVTSESRLEIGGEHSIEDELHREFGADALQTTTQLKSLQQLGEKLETLLLTSGGLPVSNGGNGLRFFRNAFLGRALRGSGQTLERFLAPLPTAPRKALTALFAGLALIPADRLSVAEAALLWTGALCGKTVAVADFAKLLQQRYEQFHGAEEDLAAIQGASRDRHKLIDLQLKKGRQCGGAWYLLGSPSGMHPIDETQPPPASRAATTQRAFTSPLDGLLPPVLRPINIPENSFPLRFSLTRKHDHTVGVLDYRTDDDGSDPLSRAAELKHTLAPLLPFGDFTIEPPLSEPHLSARRRRGLRSFPNICGDWRVLSNMLLCHGASTAPAMGAAGEILTGMTVAGILLRELKKPPLF